MAVSRPATCPSSRAALRTTARATGRSFQYVDNWLSERHERFTALSWDGWTRQVTDAGFEIDPASHAWRNDWIVENWFTPAARLIDPATGTTSTGPSHTC